MSEPAAAILAAVTGGVWAAALEIIRRRAERFEKDLKGLSGRQARQHDELEERFDKLKEFMMCLDDGNPETRREQLRQIR